MKNHALWIASSLLFLTEGVRTQSWRQSAPPVSPPSRLGHAMATDPGAGRVVVFGGGVGASYLGDTWEYDGVTWASIGGAAPPARTRAAMCCDEGNATTILFGGINGVSVSSWLPGTWGYSGGVWTQRATTFFPPRRFGHAMAYDPLRGRIVMFGGRTNAGTIFLQDTWEWTGTDWQPMTPAHAPTARLGHALAFDPQTGRIVLFGGLQLGGPYQADTWAWDGADWTLLAPPHAPGARGDHAMATDRARGRIVLRGGYDGTDLVDTWQWDGADWQAVSAAVAPGVLALAGLASGPHGHGVVLFGGEDAGGTAQAATWEFDTVASANAFGSGCGVPPLTLAAAGGSVPVLGQTFVSEIGNVPAIGLPFLALGTSATTFGALSLPLDLTAVGMTGCTLYQDLVVLGLGCAPAGPLWTNALAFPNQPAAAGVAIYAQAYALAPGANPLGLITSGALGLVLGY